MPPCPTLPSLPPVSLGRGWVPRRHRPDPRRAARIPTGSPAAGSIPRAAAALRTELRGRPGAGTGAGEGPGWAARGAPGSRHGGGRDRGPGPGRALTHPRRDLVDGVPAGVPPRLRHRVEAGQVPAALPRAQHAANPPPPPQRHCRRRRAGPRPRRKRRPGTPRPARAVPAGPGPARPAPPPPCGAARVFPRGAARVFPRGFGGRGEAEAGTASRRVRWALSLPPTPLAAAGLGYPRFRTGGLDGAESLRGVDEAKVSWSNHPGRAPRQSGPAQGVL